MKKVLPSDFDFSKAQVFRKINCFKIKDVEFSTSEQEIVTRLNGNEEVLLKAYIGDAIINRQFVLSAKQFAKLYEKDSKNQIFISKNKVAKLMLMEHSEIETPWGEIQHAKAGSFVVKSLLNGDVYFIEKEVFEKTYCLF